jgi:5-carboxymethyl-2-hydroxymuconate isomerase
MPHLSIDHSPELSDESDMQALCQKLRDALVQTGVFPLSGTRVRTHPAEACAIADGHRDNRYCAMTLSVGAGRSLQTLQTAGADIFSVAQAHFEQQRSTPHFALSLEIRVADKDLSWKDNSLHLGPVIPDGLETA